MFEELERGQTEEEEEEEDQVNTQVWRFVHRSGVHWGWGGGVKVRKYLGSMHQWLADLLGV